MSQERLQQVVAGFDATMYALGMLKPEEVVNFTFEYSGPIPIESVKAGCSCTNLGVDMLEDGRQIVSGTYKAPTKDAMARMATNYIIDDHDNLWEIKGQWATSADPRLGKVPANAVKGRKAPTLMQSIEVSFADGEPHETVDEQLVRRVNGSKTRTNITIQGIGDLS
jgi:hypothetical protein